MTYMNKTTSEYYFGIKFKTHYYFDQIPNEFEYENEVLDYIYDNKEPYDFLYKKLTVCERLYKWAKQ